MHRTIYEKSVFIDAGAFIALINSADANHEGAQSCIEAIRERKLPIFISIVTIIETHKRILFDVSYGHALQFLEDIYDGNFIILRPDKEDEGEAKRIVKKFSDQNFTLGDAINFSLIKRSGIGKVFAFDYHYSLFGFAKIPPFC